MSAPSATVWGSVVTGTADTKQGRIGIYVSTQEDDTRASANVEVWFWSKYSVSDAYNSFYFDAASSATTLIGSVDIQHTVATGSGWSTSNQTKLGSFSYNYTKGTAAATKYFSAKFTGIDLLAGLTMTASTSITVAALDSYTVAYNANGSNVSGVPSSQTKWYGTNLTLSTTKPTRTGYTFQGWATSSTGSVAYAAGATYSANASVTLYAVWKANTYTVSYNANGGSGAPSSQTKTYGVNLTLSTTKPTLTNYNFKGWGTSASSTTVSYAAGATYTANASITLYAVWELAYTKPRITGISVSRCNSAGTLTDSGTYALVKFTWACDKTVSKIEVKFAVSSTGAVSSDSTFSPSGTSGTFSQVVGSGNISADKTYTVTIYVSDTTGSTTVTRTLGGTAYTVDYLSGGNGVAFGKPAELDGTLDSNFAARFRGDVDIEGDTYVDYLEASSIFSTGDGYFEGGLSCEEDATFGGNASIAGDVRITGSLCIYGVAGTTDTIADYVIAYGTSGIWRYRKWDSGYAECFGVKSVSVSSSTSTTWGNLYTTGVVVGAQSYPFTFTSVPVEVITGEFSGNLAIPLANSVNTTTATAQVYLTKPTTSSLSGTLYIRYHVFGKWADR